MFASSMLTPQRIWNFLHTRGVTTLTAKISDKSPSHIIIDLHITSEFKLDLFKAMLEAENDGEDPPVPMARPAHLCMSTRRVDENEKDSSVTATSSGFSPPAAALENT